MTANLTRRDFLKLSALTLGSFPLQLPKPLLPPEELGEMIAIGRVTIWAIGLFHEPSYRSERVGVRFRDDLIPIYAEVTSDSAPSHNPRWYHVLGGFAHSAYLQRTNIQTNPVTTYITPRGQLGEVTVPYTQSYRYTKTYGWQPLYRLYYLSVHWITGLDEGPDGESWYRILDDLLRVHYFIPAKHVRLVPTEELTPLSPDVPPEEKTIHISLNKQTLTAYEGDKAVLHTRVSSGIPSQRRTANGIPTITPSGDFAIDRKMPVRHMGNGRLTNNLSAYELPGVPWVCFFHSTGVALHGTYWHDNYGTPMSHGCVNLSPQDAKWIFRWTTPPNYPPTFLRQGHGTRVIVK
ncbi:MAG: L,D-transpeptidase [Chloroflexota bacterium]